MIVLANIVGVVVGLTLLTATLFLLRLQPSLISYILMWASGFVISGSTRDHLRRPSRCSPSCTSILSSVW